MKRKGKEKLTFLCLVGKRMMIRTMIVSLRGDDVDSLTKVKLILIVEPVWRCGMDREPIARSLVPFSWE